MSKLTPEQIVQHEVSLKEGTYIGAYYDVEPPAKDDEATRKVYLEAHALFRKALNTIALLHDTRFVYHDRYENDEDTNYTDVFAKPPIADSERTKRISHVIGELLASLATGSNKKDYMNPWFSIESDSVETE